MLALSAHTSEFVAAYFNERAANLHHSISLREDDGTAALASFIKHYVELAPDFITSFEDFLCSAEIIGEIDQQVKTAREFLDVPLEIISIEERLEANMYQAYLAHRVLEELNDVLKINYNCPIIPIDMTRSNLIVHHIIGEPFANQIDSAIQLLNKKLISAIARDASLERKISSYLATLGNNPVTRYPCLTESSSIRLLFTTQNSRLRRH
jgi:hypothetical protein